MTQFNFGGVVEDVITSDEFSLQKARECPWKMKQSPF